MYKKILAICLFLMQPLIGMDKYGISTFSTHIEEHSGILATAVVATVFAVAWRVTKQYRERRHQRKLVEVLKTSHDKEQLKVAYGQSTNKMPLIDRCYEAVVKNDIETARLCFEAGVAPTNCFKYGDFDTDKSKSPLWTAMCNDKLDIVKLCMEHGCTPVTSIIDLPALLRAFHNQQKNIICLFLAHTKEDVTSVFEHPQFEWGWGQKYFIAKCMPLLAQYTNGKLIAFLLQKGIDLNVPDEEGYYAVHRAAQVGNIETLKVLVAHDKNQAIYPGPSGMNIVMMAAAVGNNDIIDVLWQHDCSVIVDDNAMTALHHAIQQGRLETVKKINTIINHGAHYLDEANLLQYALYNENFDCARYFIEQGVDMARVDHLGNLPLHIAALKNKCPLDLVMLFSEKTKERGLLNRQNNENRTALDIAIVSGYQETQKALTDAGAISSLVLRKPHKEKNGNK